MPDGSRIARCKVSVVVPVYDGIQVVGYCLDSLRAQTRPADEVIVVDDASSDRSADWIATRFPGTIVHRLEQNRGFPGSCNFGLAQATGDVVAFVNQDVELSETWVENVLGVLGRHPDVGIVGGLGYSPSGRLRHTGGVIDARALARHEHVLQGDEIRDVDFATAAAIAVARDALDRVGAFDESYAPGYYEDVDLCYRVREAGYRVVVARSVTYLHREESRLADRSIEFARHFHRNRLRFAFRHFDSWQIDALLSSEAERLGDHGGVYDGWAEFLTDRWREMHREAEGT